MKKLYCKALTFILFNLSGIGIQAQDGIPISSFEELNTVLRADLDGSYYLTQDIIIPEGTEWLPLGMPEDWLNGNANDIITFNGVLDGNGYSIKNLKITEEKNFSAFFGRVSGNAVIRNLGLEDVNITGGLPTGALAGTIFLSEAHYNPAITIENVFITGNIKGRSEVGAITGRENGNPLNIIRNCYIDAVIEATAENNAWAGGVVGCMNTGRRLKIENAYVTGSVKTSFTSETNCAAGILGTIDNANTATEITIENSVVALGELAGGTTAAFYGSGLFQGKATLTGNYVRNDLGFESVEGGNLENPQTFLTKFFYETLGWDVDNTWFVKEGNSPQLRTASLKKDATLQSLSVTGAELNPAFDPQIIEYHTVVSASMKAIEVDVIANYDKASVVIEGPGYGNTEELQTGENVFSITVIPELEGAQTMIYKLIVELKDNSVGIGGNLIQDTEIRVINQTLYLTYKGVADINIYDLSGKLVNTRNFTDNYNIYLEKGVYILSLNNYSYKVLIP